MALVAGVSALFDNDALGRFSTVGNTAGAIVVMLVSVLVVVVDMMNIKSPFLTLWLIRIDSSSVKRYDIG